jgi:hypothetical protein
MTIAGWKQAQKILDAEVSSAKPDSIELRITRPGMYSREQQNPEYQQGYYFTGVDYAEALGKAQKQFPHEPLHVQVVRQLIDGVWERKRT